eukprot:347516-Chlamydomonas_euryale.AAC.3
MKAQRQSAYSACKKAGVGAESTESGSNLPHTLVPIKHPCSSAISLSSCKMNAASSFSGQSS